MKKYLTDFLGIKDLSRKYDLGSYHVLRNETLPLGEIQFPSREKKENFAIVIQSANIFAASFA